MTSRSSTRISVSGRIKKRGPGSETFVSARRRLPELELGVNRVEDVAARTPERCACQDGREPPADGPGDAGRVGDAGGQGAEFHHSDHAAGRAGGGRDGVKRGNRARVENSDARLTGRGSAGHCGRLDPAARRSHRCGSGGAAAEFDTRRKCLIKWKCTTAPQ